MSASEGGSPAGRSRPRGRRQVVLSLVLLGAAGFATAAPTWLTTYASTVLDDRVEVVVTGTSAAPGVSAAALVVIAAGLALGLVGRFARWFALVVVVGGGAVITGSAVTFIRSPEAAARSGVAEATGVLAAAGDVTVSLAPYLTVVCGLAIIAVAVRAAVARIDWGSRTTKYDTPSHGAARPGGSDQAGPNQTGSERAGGEIVGGGLAGVQPTGVEPVGAGPVSSTAGGAVAGGTAAGDTAGDSASQETVLDERDTWDALTQGEDPT